MLAKMLYDVHYKDLPRLTMAIADALAAQVRHLDAEVVQVDEANLPAARRNGMGGRRDEPRARCGEDRSGRASVLRQLRRPVDPEARGHS